MNQSDAASLYRTSTFENAPPVKILRMLYEGAIRFLKRAQAMEPDDPEFRRLIRRTDDIVIELRACLDHQPNPEFSARLESLYLFINDELGKAIVECEKERLESVISILEKLLDGWRQAQLQLHAGE